MFEGTFEDFQVVVGVVKDKEFVLGETLQVCNDLHQGFGLGVVGCVFLAVRVVDDLTATVNKGNFLKVGVAFGVNDQVAHGTKESYGANRLNISSNISSIYQGHLFDFWRVSSK